MFNWDGYKVCSRENNLDLRQEHEKLTQALQRSQIHIFVEISYHVYLTSLSPSSVRIKLSYLTFHFWTCSSTDQYNLLLYWAHYEAMMKASSKEKRKLYLPVYVQQPWVHIINITGDHEWKDHPIWSIKVHARCSSHKYSCSSSPSGQHQEVFQLTQ